MPGRDGFVSSCAPHRRGGYSVRCILTRAAAIPLLTGLALCRIEGRFIRREGRGELYISLGSEVAAQFALPYMTQALRAASEEFPALR
eukprot:scaffold666_cov332-Prasinococcus_capsulatus_cf.AAC.2